MQNRLFKLIGIKRGLTVGVMLLSCVQFSMAASGDDRFHDSEEMYSAFQVQETGLGFFEKGLYHFNNKQYKEAFDFFMRAADQGYPAAQYNVGYMYSTGSGVKRDDKKAFEWTYKSANQGFLKAEYNLGYMYFHGLGVVKDHASAFKWYEKAATRGDSDAENSLGYMYANGVAVKKDATEAMKWYRRSIDKGNVNAMFNLALEYELGQLIKQDYAKALTWYTKAASAGMSMAQYNLAVMYDKGRGVKQDFKKAFSWYKKSAEGGFSHAQYNVGMMFLVGDGVEKDMKQGYYWVEQAANQSLPRAIEMLAKLKQQGAKSGSKVVVSEKAKDDEVSAFVDSLGEPECAKKELAFHSKACLRKLQESCLYSRQADLHNEADRESCLLSVMYCYAAQNSLFSPSRSFWRKELRGIVTEINQHNPNQQPLSEQSFCEAVRYRLLAGAAKNKLKQKPQSPA